MKLLIAAAFSLLAVPALAVTVNLNAGQSALVVCAACANGNLLLNYSDPCQLMGQALGE